MKKRIMKKLNNAHLLSFGIPVLMMLGILIAKGVYPFGHNSFMYSDMYHQYVPFLTEFRRRLLAGEGLAYSFRAGLGSDFFSVYAYYLASPVNWLAIFVPENLLAEFMTFFIIVKIGLCGLTFSLYLSGRYGVKDLRNVWFSVLYAMSGFVAAYAWNHMWMDSLFLAPLVILGLYRLVKEKKGGLYCLCLAAVILTNYYMAILLCVFLVLYFCLLLFTEGLSFREKCGAVGRFALCSLLAGGMAGVILIPVACAMYVTDFVGASFPKKAELYFNALEILARHVPMAPAERGLNHWPNIYCGVTVFVLVPVYLFHKKIPLRQKIGNLILLAVFLLSFSFNILNFIWHGFNYPNSLPARQSYLYIFVVLTLCFEAVYRDAENGRKNRIAGAACGLILLAACGIFVTTPGLTVRVMASAWLFLAGYLILPLFFGRHKRWAVLLLVCAESCLHMFYIGSRTVNRDNYLEKKADYQALFEAVDGGEEFFRLESADRMTKNDGILAGYASASFFSSTTNGAVADFYGKLGMGHSKVSYDHQGATPFSSALLGVRYIFSTEGLRDEELYEPVAERDGMDLYRCRYSLPVGFVLTPELYEGLQRQLAENTTDPVAMQNRLMSVLGVRGPLFALLTNSEVRSEDGGIRVTALRDGHLYGALKGEKRGLVLERNGEEETVKEADSKEILDLGYLKAGESICLRPDEDEKEDGVEKAGLHVSVYRLSPEVLAEGISILGRRPLAAAVERDELTGRVISEEGGYLVLSVPAVPGFKVEVDGRETPYEKFGDAMIAVLVEAGEHEITVRYAMQGFKEGIAVSACSLLLFTAALVGGGKKKKGANIKNGVACEGAPVV